MKNKRWKKLIDFLLITYAYRWIRSNFKFLHIGKPKENSLLSDTGRIFRRGIKSLLGNFLCILSFLYIFFLDKVSALCISPKQVFSIKVGVCSCKYLRLQALKKRLLIKMSVRFFRYFLNFNKSHFYDSFLFFIDKKYIMIKIMKF